MSFLRRVRGCAKYCLLVFVESHQRTFITNARCEHVTTVPYPERSCSLRLGDEQNFLHGYVVECEERIRVIVRRDISAALISLCVGDEKATRSSAATCAFAED